MLISVIITAYNEEEHIKESIYSILAQTHKNIEIIICDDASTDRTCKIVQDFEKKDCRVRCFRNKKNMRQAASRNRCIFESKGQYIVIQDADDISKPNRITKLLEAIKKNKQYDFVSSAMYLFDDKGIRSKTKPIKYPLKQDFLKGAPFAHGATMFKREALLAVNGYRISKETERGEDEDLFMRLFIAGYHGFNLSEALYEYRVDENTYSRRKFIYRIHTVIYRYKNFKNMNLLPMGYIYLLRPIIAGFIPRKIIYKIGKIFRNL